MTQATHVLVAGPSGGGKTTYSRKLFATHDAGGRIWINHNREPDTWDTTTARSFAEVRRQLRSQGETAAIDYQPQVSPQQAASLAVRAAVDASGETLVLADEAAVLMPEGVDRQDNGLAWAFHQGRSHGVRVALCSQDPVELAYPPLKNIKYLVWCGPAKTFHRGFLRFYGIEPSMLPKSDHQYRVIKPTEPPEVIAEGETDASYNA